MRAARVLVVALSGLLGLAGAVLAVVSFLDGDVPLGVLWGFVAVAGAWSVVQEARRGDRAAASAAAAADWPPERVHATVGGVEGEVQQVRALRRADPALGLADAAALVRGLRG
ncbi:hypothetical protein SAMN03159343_0724 [Klenkia marina]|uniref:Uncharacterized protein n=1 Tax=Klenkia marina TaxID=1960309 RepID=A0A1G4XG42_9ACTN|nr:hypothetical protein [Klenkia marina]SCX39638.1 hypothetical protein SAMN03159343_0724 [Klenkia marina]